MPRAIDIHTLARRPWQVYYGWWVVGAGAAINLVGAGIFSFGASLFFLPISRELCVSYTVTAAVFSAGRALSGLSGPVVGWLLDRLGSRPLVIAGGLLASSGYLAFSQVHSYSMFALMYLTLITPGFALGMSQTVLATTNLWFERRRALAMAVVGCSFALGGALITPVLAKLLSALGWRGAAAMGLAVLATLVPLALLIRRPTEDLGLAQMMPRLRPPGVCLRWRSAGKECMVRETLCTTAFRTIAAATTLAMFALLDAVAEGVAPLNWSLVGEFFGRQRYETLVGIINAIYTLPNLGAPIVTGWVYDRTGSYTPVLLMLSLFTLGSAAMFSITRKPACGGALASASKDE